MQSLPHDRSSPASPHARPALVGLALLEIGGLHERGRIARNFHPEHFDFVREGEDELEVAPLRRRLVARDLEHVHQRAGRVVGFALPMTAFIVTPTARPIIVVMIATTTMTSISENPRSREFMTTPSPTAKARPIGALPVEPGYPLVDE